MILLKPGYYISNGNPPRIWVATGPNTLSFFTAEGRIESLTILKSTSTYQYIGKSPRSIYEAFQGFFEKDKEISFQDWANFLQRYSLELLTLVQENFDLNPTLPIEDIVESKKFLKLLERFSNERLRKSPFYATADGRKAVLNFTTPSSQAIEEYATQYFSNPSGFNPTVVELAGAMVGIKTNLVKVLEQKLKDHLEAENAENLE